MFTKRYWNTFDFLLVIIVTALVAFGIVAIGSATRINLGEDSYNRDIQIVWFAVGFVLMIMATFVDYNFIGKFFVLIYLVNVVLLVAVLVVGDGAGGAVRWIVIGPARLQPSEFSKIMTLIVIAKTADLLKKRINNVFVLILLVTLGLIPVYLIQKQPSLSSSLVLAAILIVELYVSKVSYFYIIPVVIIGVAAVLFVVWDVQQETSFLLENQILYSHQVNRIMAFIQPEEYSDAVYQTNKAITALGSGQLYGKGLYGGTLNQMSYLPEPHTDFIFSVIGEEFGFTGCMFVIILLCLIILKCIIISAKAEDNFGRLLAAGIAGMFAFQSIVNICVVTGLLPNTGMPLPFVSYGGSAMWTNMIGIGLVLNVGMKRVKQSFF